MVALRRKLTALATTFVAVVLAVTGVVLVSWQHRQLLGGVDDTLRRDADATQASLEAGSVVGGNTGDERGVQVVRADGTVLTASAILAGEPPLAATPTTGDRLQTVRLPIDDDSFRLISRRVDLPSGTFTIHLVETLSDVHDSVRALTDSLLIAFPALLVLLAVLTWWLVGRTLRPVAAAAQRQEQFVADASHELRTPLARARTRLEVDIAHPAGVDAADTMATVLAELRDLERLVDDLLFLARNDADIRPRRDDVTDLDDVVFAEVQAMRADAPTLTVDTSAVSAARVRGDGGDLARAVRNVLDNARRHASARVGVALAESNGDVTLTIEDDGPGISADRRADVFDRFVRIDTARPPGSGNTGLGLAIARDIVVRHGGAIDITDSVWGGSRLTISLPRAD
jgi:signal transduction histidine kinase